MPAYRSRTTTHGRPEDVKPYAQVGNRRRGERRDRLVNR